MSAGLHDLLTHWAAARDRNRWVLGSIVRTQGPCYRKAGAMLLLNDAGEHFGLLSGGCLEVDIARHAQRLLQSGGARTISYDTSDEGDAAFQLGCGGSVEILLQCIGQGSEDLGLGEVLQRLDSGRSGWLVLEVPDGRGEARGYVLRDADAAREALTGPTPWQTRRARLLHREGKPQLLVPFAPEPAMLVVGGGVDARPLVAMACELGFRVSVCDPRPAFARARHFHAAAHMHRGSLRQLQPERFDAAMVMSHNLALDAEALRWLRDALRLRYLGLLGPASRKARVLELADIDEGQLPCRLSGPAGLDLGGELPADIALSILAECQLLARLEREEIDGP